MSAAPETKSGSEKPFENVTDKTLDKTRNSRHRSRTRKPANTIQDKIEPERSPNLQQGKKAAHIHPQKSIQQDKNPQATPAADGSMQPKKSDGRRRYYHRKPKSPGAPKSE